eukprot:m.149249 g.149249  ORF g.149249 m.149249 type:complete len:384 (-) comp52758_c0_seq1:94-1245(-)
MVRESGSIISKIQFERLREHKYSCENNSLAEPYMQPFWRKAVKYLPLWVAPNLLTLSGMIVHMLTIFNLMLHTPHIGHPTDLPPWTLFLAVFGLFFYQLFDALDGKQARRTGSASVLGELFDHGCDSMTTIFLLVGTCIALQMRSEFQTMLSVFVGLLGFYVSHWRAYVTGKLTFGKLDCTEAQFTVMLLYAVTGIFGAAIWHTPLFSFASFSLTIADALWLFMVLSAGAAILGHTNHIFKDGIGVEGTSVAESSCLAPLIPLIGFLFSFYHIMSFGVDAASYRFLFAAGFAASKLSNKLILGHMSKSPLPQFDVNLLVPLMFTVNYRLDIGFDPEFLVLVSCFIYLVTLVVYWSQVCFELASHLQIRVLTIDAPSKPLDEAH